MLPEMAVGRPLYASHGALVMVPRRIPDHIPPALFEVIECGGVFVIGRTPVRVASGNWKYLSVGVYHHHLFQVRTHQPLEISGIAYYLLVEAHPRIVAHSFERGHGILYNGSGGIIFGCIFAVDEVERADIIDHIP